MPSTAPIACNLSAIPDAERPRYFTLRAQVLAAAKEVTETSTGYARQFRADHALFMAVAEWIGFERVCCPFLAFHLAVDGDDPVHLEIGGPEGVKDFLRGELVELGPGRLLPSASLVRRR